MNAIIGSKPGIEEGAFGVVHLCVARFLVRN